MRLLDQLRMRVQMLFGRGRAASRLDDELSFHIEHQIAENIAAGMNPEEARYSALRIFGNPVALREQSRATWSWNWIESIVRDLRYGLRTLARTPGFSVMAVIVMALCLGAATSLFTIVRSVLLRPLPFRDPSRLLMVYEHFRSEAANQDKFNYNSVSAPDYFTWRSETHGFEDMAAWRGWRFNLSGERAELPEAITAAAGTWNLFPLLGVQPAVGRTFTEVEDRPGSNSVMLTWSVFQRRFAGDPSIMGRQIRLDGKPCTVVGVQPASFIYPEATVQVWVPYQAVDTPEWLSHYDWHESRVVARLRQGMSLSNAMSQVEAVQYRLHMQYLHEPVAEDAVSRTINSNDFKVFLQVLPTMYFPILNGSADVSLSLAVHSTGDPLAMSVPLQRQIAALDPQLPVSDVLTLPQVIGDSLGNASFSATLVMAFAVLSLLLASVGLYGVLSYLMTQRMTEIGIRIALGAQREQVLRLAFVDGLRPAILGLVFGLAASVAAVRLIQTMLYKTEPLDPAAVFAVVAATLLTVAAIACLVPAWRASRLDPMQALRTE